MARSALPVGLYSLRPLSPEDSREQDNGSHPVEDAISPARGRHLATETQWDFDR